MRSNIVGVLGNLSVLIGGVAATLLVVLGSSLPHADKVAAVFPPWWSPARAFGAAAGAGRIVALGQLSSILIVHGEPAELARHLRAAGALLVFDSSLSAGCRSASVGSR